MNCSGNHLRICKMKLVNGRMVKPDGSEVFHINVESCSQRRHYRLNASNNFCVELDYLSNEEICVYEEDTGYVVSYEIDGVESDEACVNFNRQSFHQITIINHEEDPQEFGSLRLNKRVYNRCGREISSTDTFRVEMVGDNFTRNVTLSPSNNYTTLIENIPFGNYEVRELNGEDYDVTYVVDGIESDVGNIEIDAPTGTMLIRNQMNNGTHFLRICKWIREENRLVKPEGTDSYEIKLSDGYAIREYTLNCDNHFCITVEGNRNDTFTLEEINAENVEYEVNGEIVDEVEVTMNTDQDVRIINLSSDTGVGSIIIRKWLEEDGRLVVPASDMSFRLRIQGYSDDVYTLNDRNNFTLRLNNVDSGYYFINEEETEGYEVFFEVNGNAQEDGYFRVEENDETRIDMINRESNSDLNVITILKRVNSNNEDGVEIPSEGSFEVYLEGPEGGTYFTLNRSNNYQVRYFAIPGWYTMYEVNPIGEVTYRLDGVDHDNELQFYVDGFNHEAMVINHINRVNYVL